MCWVRRGWDGVGWGGGREALGSGAPPGSPRPFRMATHIATVGLGAAERRCAKVCDMGGRALPAAATPLGEGTGEWPGRRHAGPGPQTHETQHQARFDSIRFDPIRFESMWALVSRSQSRPWLRPLSYHHPTTHPAVSLRYWKLHFWRRFIPKPAASVSHGPSFRLLCPFHLLLRSFVRSFVRSFRLLGFRA